jgi:predicted ArsR family transcriptional regulator
MTMQADLFAQPARASVPLARRSDPGTSKAAAESAQQLAQRHQGLILACLREHGALGKDGIGARTALTGVQVCRRLVELERLGLVRQTGKTVASTAGRQEREWEACGGKRD